jgi:hypothetical protein
MSVRERKKSATRTIRLESEQDTALIKEAERRGYSVNSLIGHIFDRYLTGYRYFDMTGMVVMNGETINEFLEKLTISDIKEIGEQAGRARIKSSLMQRGKRINFENMKWFISQVLGENHGWYRCDVQEEGKQVSFHLTHQLGYKWSVFLGSYIPSAFADVLELKCNTVIMNKAINIEVNRS